MKGAISIGGQDYYTYIDRVFDAIDQAQLDYNWLISNYECNIYPDDRISVEHESDYVWLTGEEITEIVSKNHIQFWDGVLSGFNKNVRLPVILKYNLPKAGFSKDKIAIQHPFAEIEIIPFDSSLVALISNDDALVDKFIKAFPKSLEFETYNMMRGLEVQ